LHPALPPGVVHCKKEEKNSHKKTYAVKSSPISLPGHEATCVIKGNFDIVIDFDDGSYGVVDFKTGKPDEEKPALFSRQLHAYAYALEHPAKGALSLSPISKMGLLYFYPSKTSQKSIDWLSFDAKIQWIEIKKNEQKFLNFIDEVLSVLESPEPPEPSPKCEWCKYIREIEEMEDEERRRMDALSVLYSYK